MDKEYLPRIVDNELKERLDSIGAVLIEGPKWCGKTTTAEQIAGSVLRMQDPDTLQSNLLMAETKPSLLLKGEKPRLLDEWQVAPVLWDAVRSDIDRVGEFGQYILTGSNTVDYDEVHHSGTGRIDRMTMLPMSLYESNDSNGKISLKALFDNSELDIDGIESDLTIEELVYVAACGGWPISLKHNDIKKALNTAKSYFNSVCNIDCITVDGVRRDPRRMKAIMKSYARNVSTLATDKAILKDVAANDSVMDIKTLKSYLEALEKLFVVYEVPAWCPDIRSATAIRSSNKREFVDPSIAVAALGVTPDELLLDLNTFGFIFETLCIRDLRAYSSALGGVVSYYHDRSGLEADAVLHLDDGRYALIEMKLGSRQIDDGAKHLIEIRELIRKHNETNDIKMREPDFLMVLTGGNMAYTREDGVKIVPIGCLRN